VRILIVWRRYGGTTLGPMDGIQIGYARVSTTDQHPPPNAALRSAGPECHYGRVSELVRAGDRKTEDLGSGAPGVW